MIQLYYHLSPNPNPNQVALFREESGLRYELIPVDPGKGEQHLLNYIAINPDAKTPSLVKGDTVAFDSGAILLYLADKTRLFLARNTQQVRAQMYSWLKFIASGIRPYSGQAVHFRHFAADHKDYALMRYEFEAWRHWRILEARLSKSRYMLGDEYTLVNMAVWGWARTSLLARPAGLG
ncbi:glutathione S-transferase family protein [Pseudomonas sp. L13]|uniref:glutathione S-transferase family protein n=1 Tax=Pseudomonas sp. L13 TaxID=343985 RepID=UPI0021154B1D|nr:glutathione S-transferase N-terminal domain-containing protein [Pseudomonas sp. L13]